MKKLIITWFGVVFFSILQKPAYSSQPGYPCPSDIVQILSRFNQIRNTRPVWKSIDGRNLRVGIIKDKTLFLTGLSPNEMRDLQLRFTSCTSASSLMVAIDPPRNLLEERTGNNTMRSLLPINYASHGVNDYDPPTPQRFRHYLRHPMDIFFWPFEIPTKWLAKIPDFEKNFQTNMPQFISHEAFHGFQLKLFKGIFDTDIGDQVRRELKQPQFQAEVIQELKELKALETRLPSLTKEEAIAFSHRLVSRRTKSPHAKKWERIATLERAEGTADYFSTASGKAAHLPMSSVFEDWKNRLSPEILTNMGSESFYSSGAMICYLLHILDPSDAWQTEVEQGSPQFLVLQRLLGTH